MVQCMGGGDVYFSSRFAIVGTGKPRCIRKDLRDIALAVIARHKYDIEPAQLRGTGLTGRLRQQLRYLVVREARAAGHSGVAIAAFLAISPSRVSEIARSTTNVEL
jgi:hypothetical protein